jgi:hypothetical protein
MHYQAIFLAPLLGNKEEEAPKSTMRHQLSISLVC